MLFFTPLILLAQTPEKYTYWKGFQKIEFEFAERAAWYVIGLVLTAGPDAGIIRYAIDNGPEKTVDLFTQWSAGLHLPWYILLEDELKNENHTLKIRLG